MKRIMKIVNLVLVFIMVLSSKTVNADNYKMMELIPKEKKVTIRGDQLLYKDIEFKDGKIVIGQIKNITDEKKSITISIGLFGSDRRNITIINRMLGRIGDIERINNNKSLNKFTDIDGHWAYYGIVEATITHEYEFKEDIEIWK